MPVESPADNRRIPFSAHSGAVDDVFVAEDHARLSDEPVARGARDGHGFIQFVSVPRIQTIQPNTKIPPTTTPAICQALTRASTHPVAGSSRRLPQADDGLVSAKPE